MKTKARERPPGNKGRDSREPHHGAAGRPPPDRGEDTTGEGRSGRRRGAKALERLPGHLAGPGGGGVPRLGGTRKDPGEGVGTKQHKDRKELVEGHTKERKENRSRSEEPENHKKDPKKEGRQGQPEKVGNERKAQSPGHPGPLGKLQGDSGDSSGYRKGQGGGGTPWPLRTCQNTGKGQGTEEQHEPRKRQENSVGKVWLGEQTRQSPGRTMKSGKKIQR